MWDVLRRTLGRPDDRAEAKEELCKCGGVQTHGERLAGRAIDELDIVRGDLVQQLLVAYEQVERAGPASGIASPEHSPARQEATHQCW